MDDWVLSAGVERIRIDIPGVDSESLDQQGGYLDHGRRAAQIGAPAVQLGPIGRDRIDDGAASQECALGVVRHDMDMEIAVSFDQLVQPSAAVDVAGYTQHRARGGFANMPLPVGR